MAKALMREAQAWMADPANDATRRALVEQLRGIAEKAGGAAGQLSARLAKEVERPRVSVAAWERDLMSLRYEIADMAPGQIRDAALDAYVAQASAAVHLIDDPSRPEQARDVLRALEAEERMLAGERLTARRAAPGHRGRRRRPGRLRRARRRPRPDAMSDWDAIVCGGSFAGLAAAGQIGGRVLVIDRLPDRRRRDVGVRGAAALPGAARPARLRRPGARRTSGSTPAGAASGCASSTSRRSTTGGSARRCSRAPAPSSCATRITGAGEGVVHTTAGTFTAPIVIEAAGWRTSAPKEPAAPGAAAAQELRRGGTAAVPRRGPPLLGRPGVGDAPLLVGVPGGRPRAGGPRALRRPLVAVGRPHRLPRAPRSRRRRPHPRRLLHLADDRPGARRDVRGGRRRRPLPARVGRGDPPGARLRPARRAPRRAGADRAS